MTSVKNDLDKEAPMEDIEHDTKMECLDYLSRKGRPPRREGRIILETIWFAQKMASKENEEREHPGDKKTGVKLIYQGQEKKVIIVSTVRSSPEYVSMDSQNKLGFLFNSKRFNLGMKTENVRIMWEREQIQGWKRELVDYVDKSDPTLGDQGESAADEGKGRNVTSGM